MTKGFRVQRRHGAIVLRRPYPLSLDEYNDLIEDWNNLTTTERQAKTARCHREGHEFATIPEDHGSFVCRRCVRHF